MNDSAALGAEKKRLARGLRQHLESLRRAGVDYVPSKIVMPPPTEVMPAPVAPGGHVEPVAQVDIAGPLKAVVHPAPPPPAPLMPPAALFGDLEAEMPEIPAADRPAALATLALEVSKCTRCPILASTRTQTVFGVGAPTARLMFIGEAPGADEDRTGVPFVGRAGQLLTDMITKGMGLKREDVYIANILKSRPPENRNPLPEEMANCLPFLERQIGIVRPEFLCLLGKVAASALLDTALPLGKLRGRWHRYRGIPTIVTYHPAYLLRNPASKRDSWEDLQILMKAMGITPPGRKKA